MRNEIRIAGFGGQGVVTIGVLLAKTAGEYEGWHVAQSQSYGPEARGGACKTDVILSDGDIDYIKPLDIRYLLVMHQPALDIYGGELSADGFLLADSTLVSNIPEHFRSTYRIPATAMAEKLGIKIAANIVIFGALAKLTGWVSRESCEKALADNLPPQMVDKNFAAFALGYEAFEEPFR